ncbi:hypothetical protein [Streptomyces sp. NPDC059909]|uniref:hypothetical protein n=1 Tax=Streptomyces sp. NPDC059909 TaxID=3346998 RepID=UPI0036661FC0
MSPDTVPPTAPPPQGHHRGPATPWGDAALALFMLFVDAVALAVTTLCVFLATWRDRGEPVGKPPGDAPGPRREAAADAAPTPSVDWGPYIGYGIAAALIALTAYAFVRSGHRITAGTQVLAVVVLTVGLLSSGALEYRGTHPGPVPAPAGDRCVCHSARRELPRLCGQLTDERRTGRPPSAATGAARGPVRMTHT